MLASHLDKNFDTKNMASIPSRNGYGEGLVEAGKRDERVVALAADLTESTRTLPFAEAFPNRLGGAVAEHLSEVLPKKIMRIGVNDQFGQSGEPDELIAHYKMDINSIVEAGKMGIKS